MKAFAAILLVVGVLAVIYGGFSYTKHRTEAKVGPVEIGVNEKHRVNIPLWAGVGAIVLGGGLLMFGGKKP